MNQIMNRGWKASQCILWLLVVLALSATPLWAFNSEEHKLMGDWAVSEIRRDTEIELPGYTRFEPVPVSRKSYRAAKELAVGEPPDTGTEETQDNSYWTGYSQRDGSVWPGTQDGGNLNLWVPPLKYLRENQLVVTSYLADNSPKVLTFGDLMSLYGDYRRTTYCTSTGICKLTHADTRRVNFNAGADCFFLGKEVRDNNLLANCGFRPPEIESVAYLRHIAAGLWPPFHSLGNLYNDTAANDEYFEAGWWGDEMIRIAATNDWHFSNGAIAWYIGMHRLALYWVNEAITRPDANGNLPNVNLWNNALHAEANALHSLTDLFAFGHVVTSRDETSYNVMAEKDLLSKTAYQYMEHILIMGGAGRSGSGRISLNANLPPISQIAQPSRNDFLASSLLGTGYAGWAKQEHQFHSDFNESGANVRNLKGNSLRILGDGDLRNMTDGAKDVLKEAVRESVQSLFDAYVRIDRYGATVAELGAAGSDYFNALRYIPVYVESTPGGHFTGEWTRYAGMIDDVSGADVVPGAWGGCQMSYINGEVWDSELDNYVRNTPCTTFPTVAANNSPTEPQLVSPSEGENGTGLPVTFEWTSSTDPDGDAVEYNLEVCEDPSFPQSCGVSLVIPAAASPGTAAATASGLGLFLLAIGIAGSTGVRRRVLLGLGVILLTGLLLTACGDDYYNYNYGSNNSGNPSTVSYTRTDLTPATTYSWRVVAYDGKGDATTSTTGSFSTQ